MATKTSKTKIEIGKNEVPRGHGVNDDADEEESEAKTEDLPGVGL